MEPDGLIEHAANYVLERQNGESVLTVSDWWTPAIDQVLESGRADRLVLNYAHGFHTDDLAKIDEWPITSLQLLDRAAKDLTPITRLKSSLRDLSIEPAPNARLDLTLLPQLTELASTWSAVSRTISAPNLERLFLMGYRERDLAPLRDHAALTQLRIKGAWTLQTLDGLPEGTALRELLVALAPKLHDATGLRAARGTLTNLSLESCRKIPSTDFVAECPELYDFCFADCGSVDSLGPLLACGALRAFRAWGTTRIEDGDLQPLLELPLLATISLAPRRHYRPSVAEIKATLDGRTNRGHDAG